MGRRRACPGLVRVAGPYQHQRCGEQQQDCEDRAGAVEEAGGARGRWPQAADHQAYQDKLVGGCGHVQRPKRLRLPRVRSDRQSGRA